MNTLQYGFKIYIGGITDTSSLKIVFSPYQTSVWICSFSFFLLYLWCIYFGIYCQLSEFLNMITVMGGFKNFIIHQSLNLQSPLFIYLYQYLFVSVSVSPVYLFVSVFSFSHSVLVSLFILIIRLSHIVKLVPMYFSHVSIILRAVTFWYKKIFQAYIFFLRPGLSHFSNGLVPFNISGV